MANIVWSGYDTVINLLGTQLNSLAADAVCGPSGGISNAGGKVYADIEFIAGAAFSPVSGGYIDLWFLRSLDGTNYWDGGVGVVPATNPDISIIVRGGTSITPRCGASGLILPPGNYRVVARNKLATTLPASGSLIRMASYSETI